MKLNYLRGYEYGRQGTAPMSRRIVWGTVGACAIAVTLSCRSTGDKPHASYFEKTMTVTAYCDCQKCCGWKRNWYGKPVHAYGPKKGQYKKPGKTASGVQARKGTIAASRQYAFGTVMEIPGYGRGVVEDRGSAVDGEHIDVFFKRHEDALAWGRQRLVVRIWNYPVQVAQSP